MRSRLLVSALALSMVLAARLSAEDTVKAECKCPVSGKACKAEHFVEFEGGKVYFCCGNCPKAFENDKEKFAAKARHQMVINGQLEQEHCPITHKAFKDGTEIQVSGAEIKFCCNNCKGSVEKMATDDEKIAACFGKADCFKAVKK
jgi:hypothetical protein